MAKKTRRPASETLVKSILADLEKDLRQSQSESSLSSPSSSSSAYAEDGSRHLPEGLESETAIFGKKKPKDSSERAPISKIETPTKSEAAPAAKSSKAPATPEEATLHIGPGSSTPAPVDEASSPFKQDFSDRTIPMSRASVQTNPPEAAAPKVSHGLPRPLTKSSASLAASVTEAQMLQAENLRVAQNRILELERECERLRSENELLASAGEIAKQRSEELLEKVQEIERLKIDSLDHAKIEMNIYRENVIEKDKQITRMKLKIEELETRLAKDLKKIRVRERELENRLELSKLEKSALMRAKDDALLDLKNKVDQLHQELESYKLRCAELNQKVDGQHEQLGRTVRALRLALAHLEANESSNTLTPLKKAE